MTPLLVIGSSNTDLSVTLPRLPQRGETALGGSLLQGPGGKGANQAVACARAGAQVVFLTAVGGDGFGKSALDRYAAEGIDARFVRVFEDEPSGVALILLDREGENIIAVAPGANARLAPADVDALPSSLFVAARVLLVAGLEVNVTAAERAVERARGAGMTVIVNPAPAVPLPPSSPLLKWPHVLTPNRGELAILTGLPTETREQIDEAGGRLIEGGAGNVVVTLGPLGCLVYQRGERPLRIPSLHVVAVDTVGAGDAFSGALAVALAEGKALADAARWANAAAALSVTRPGAQAGLARRDEIDRFLSSA